MSDSPHPGTAGLLVSKVDDVRRKPRHAGLGWDDGLFEDLHLVSQLGEMSAEGVEDSLLHHAAIRSGRAVKAEQQVLDAL
jgi:hypothetical protein